MDHYEYPALFASQGTDKTVFAFCAPAADILSFAAIDRIGRSETGKLKGFQRPLVANHIKEIRDYLAKEEAVLPNSVVVAFTSGVKVTKKRNGAGNVSIEVKNGKPGLVVDGQQRISALSEVDNPNFQVFVTGLICEDEDELRKQFILINNSRPLPKALIYELLPTVDGLPHRLSSRSAAAKLIEQLNYDEASSLKGQIKQHTNPTGVIQDTVMQKLIMTSLADGVLRERMQRDCGDNSSFQLLSDFFAAVQKTFADAWIDRKPRTSRLVHGAGIISMGYVMEHLYSTEGAETQAQFEAGLVPLKIGTAWTEGVWEFGKGNIRPWNSIQFVPRDYMELSQHLLRALREFQRKR